MSISFALMLIFITLYTLVILLLVFSCLKLRDERARKMLSQLETSSIEDIEYTNKMIDLVEKLITQICIIRFRRFKSSHDLSLVTEIQFKKLISDTSGAIKESFNNTIDYDKSLLNENFYDTYIIEMTVDRLQELLSREL